jgi:hypothetical protein
LALVRPQSILSLGAAVIYLKIVAPVYLTSALININKEKEKNTGYCHEGVPYQPMTRTLCLPK